MYANPLALGREHTTCDRLSVTSQPFGADPWYRVDLHWNDGAHVYVTYDTEAEAVAHAARLGFLAKEPARASR